MLNSDLDYMTRFRNELDRFANPSTSWEGQVDFVRMVDQVIRANLRKILEQTENQDTAKPLRESLFALSNRMSKEQKCNTPKGRCIAFKLKCLGMGILSLGSRFEWAEGYNQDALQLILSKSLPSKSQEKMIRRLADFQRVSKEWNTNVEIIKKNWVEQGGISIEASYGCKTAEKAVECIINKGLLRADLYDFPDITDNDLKNLIDQCPNLNHLSVELPEKIRRFSLEKLTNLQTLRLLAPNVSEDELIVGLEALKGLTSLNLDTRGKGDQIKLAKGLITLSQLETLILRNFDLSADDTRLSTFDQLKTWVLRNFNLSGSDIMVDALKSLTKLTHLELNHCGFLSADKLGQALKTLPHLTSLSLADNRISGKEFVAMLKEQNQLTVLNLCHCELSEDELADLLQGFTQLSSLNLSCCKQISTNVVKIVKNLSQLTDLDLSYCHKLVSFGPPDELKNLSKLTKLNLAGSNIPEDLLAEALKNLPQLTTLKLTNCDKLKGDKLEEVFKSLPHLTCVVLRGCHEISRYKLYTWKQQYPKINFIL